MLVATRMATRLWSRSVVDHDVFHEGYEARRDRLDEALRRVGLEPEQLEDPRLAGSPGPRLYRSFVLPKSEKALAMASQPHRATTVAAEISYSVRETVAATTAWLENRDRTLKSRDAVHDLTVILDGLRSGENVGNIIRTVETAGGRAVVACGTTPAPPSPAVLKGACHAAEYVSVTVEPSAIDLVRRLKDDGVTVWALETTAHADSLYALTPPSPLALVLGNELVGVSPDVMQLCDRTVAIPTFGIKNSLNVGSAAAVAIYEVVRQWSAREGRR